MENFVLQVELTKKKEECNLEEIGSKFILATRYLLRHLIWRWVFADWAIILVCHRLPKKDDYQAEISPDEAQTRNDHQTRTQLFYIANSSLG